MHSPIDKEQPFSTFIPLRRAAQNTNAQTLELLLDAGADVNALAKYFRTPLSTFIKASIEKNTLDHALPIVKKMIKKGATQTINLPTDETPLYMAVRASNIPIIKYLLEHGAHDAINNPTGWFHDKTMLDVSQSPEVDRTLILYGANQSASDSPERRNKIAQKIQTVEQEIAQKTEAFEKSYSTLTQELQSFVPPAALAQTICGYLKPLTLDQQITANHSASKRRVQEIRDRLARQASAATSSAPTVVCQNHAQGNVTRHPLDTDDEKHDARGNIVPPRTQTEGSLD